MINNNLSIQLDGLRGFAALYIICHHYFLDLFMNVEPWKHFYLQYLFCFGQEVVIIFLLLSGFLSYFSWYCHPDISVARYLNKRFFRIYPLYLFSIILSVVIALIVGSNELIDFGTIVGNLLFLQDSSSKPGMWFATVGNNGPLWYLSYQWWCYVLFILFCKISSERRRDYMVFFSCFVGMISYLLYPNHASLVLWYYWIFYLGTYIASCYINRSRWNLFVPISSIIMIIIWVNAFDFPNSYPFGEHPNVELRHFLIACLLFFVSIAAYRYGFHRFISLSFFRSLASCSLAIYLFQVPILHLICNRMGYRITTACLSLLICVAFSYVIEVELIGRLLKHK